MNYDDELHYPDLALDFETFAVSDHNPAIISIGLVAFDAEIQDRGLATVKFNIDPIDAVKNGTVDGSTIMWWLDQPDEARKKLTNPASHISVHDALEGMQAFVTKHAPGARLWTNGPAQDETWWRSLCRIKGFTFPVHHSKGRDIRTIREFIPQEAYDAIGEGLVKHDALSDAIWASRIVQAFYGMLRSHQVIPWER